MAIEFAFRVFLVAINIAGFVTTDHLFMKGIFLVFGVICAWEAADRWGYFWDGPDE